MSSDNVNTVRRAYEAFNRRDVDGFLEAADDDVVQDWSRAVGPEQGVFCGRNEVARFVRSWLDAFEEAVVVVDELTDAGDHVIARFHGRQRGRSSGAEVEGHGSILVWTFRDGKVIAATLYQDRGEALAAVGRPGAPP